MSEPLPPNASPQMELPWMSSAAGSRARTSVPPGRAPGWTGNASGLWREFARLVGELRPRYVIVENVAALLSRGLGRVLGDLAALGYHAEWHCIPASAIGARHRRDRVWIIADAEGLGFAQQPPSADLTALFGSSSRSGARGSGGDSSSRVEPSGGASSAMAEAMARASCRRRLRATPRRAGAATRRRARRTRERA